MCLHLYAELGASSLLSTQLFIINIHHMFTTHSIPAITGIFAVAILSMVLGLTSFAAPADAASYAYVDRNGEVKQVTANDWMTAIDIAPNIHINSGVLLLRAASDFDIVGDEVPSV